MHTIASIKQSEASTKNTDDFKLVESKMAGLKSHHSDEQQEIRIKTTEAAKVNQLMS